MNPHTCTVQARMCSVSVGFEPKAIKPKFDCFVRYCQTVPRTSTLTDWVDSARCHIFMPDDAAEEKSAEIRAFGARVTQVRPVSISHPGVRPSRGST